MGMLTFRRYRMRLAQTEAQDGNIGTAAVHKAAHAADTTGTPLPADFPAVDLLAAAEPVPYTTYEDLYAATLTELQKISGVGRKTAQRILDAYTTWDAAQG